MQALRWVLNLSSTVLYLPIVNSLCKAFSCRHGGALWLNTTVVCYSGSHVAALVAASLLLLVFTAAMVLCKSMGRSPLHRSSSGSPVAGPGNAARRAQDGRGVGAPSLHQSARAEF